MQRNVAGTVVYSLQAGEGQNEGSGDRAAPAVTIRVVHIFPKAVQNRDLKSV